MSAEQSSATGYRGLIHSHAGARSWSTRFRFRAVPKRNRLRNFRSLTRALNLYTPPAQRYGEKSGMGTPRTIDGDGRSRDRRREPRADADLGLVVWGVDTRGDRFLQEARARDISLSGALLTGLDAELRSGDVIGILYAGKKARYRVVWVRHSGTSDKVQAAVHRFPADVCPWKELLTEEHADTEAAVDPAAPEPPH